MSNQRRAAVGQGSGSPTLLAVGGQYLSGTTPNRPNLIIYDTSDWSVWDSKVIGSEAATIRAIAQDSDYIYLGLDASPYFAIYIKATKELMTGVTAPTSTIYSIQVNEYWVYVCREVQIYRYPKGSYGTLGTLGSLFTGSLATSSDNEYIYGYRANLSPDNLVKIAWDSFTATNIPIASADLFSLNSIVNDANNVYFGCASSSAINRFFVIRKSDNANITNSTYTTASNTLRAMTQDDNYVYFGVSNGEFRRVIKSSLVIESAAQTFDSAIWCMLNLGDTIAVGGDFTDKFKLVPKSNLATTVSGTPALAGTVRSLCLIS